jgi:hypothetical protein
VTSAKTVEVAAPPGRLKAKTSLRMRKGRVFAAREHLRGLSQDDNDPYPWGIAPERVRKGGGDARMERGLEL